MTDWDCGQRSNVPVAFADLQSMKIRHIGDPESVERAC